MANQFLRKMIKINTTLKTYRVLLLQARTYRILKTILDDSLTDHQINVLEWTILGLLHDHKKGLRYNDIATTLAVEPPFITKMISILMKKNLVIDSAHEKDKRAKKVSLTDEGRQLVDKIETILKKDMNTLLKDVHIADTLSYLDTMDRIVENGMTAIKAK